LAAFAKLMASVSEVQMRAQFDRGMSELLTRERLEEAVTKIPAEDLKGADAVDRRSLITSQVMGLVRQELTDRFDATNKRTISDLGQSIYAHFNDVRLLATAPTVEAA
jgi:hypothetical protein